MIHWSLCLPLKLPVPGLDHLLSTHSFSKLLQSGPLSYQHSVTFLAQSARDLPQSSPKHMVRSHNPGINFCRRSPPWSKATWGGKGSFVLHFSMVLTEVSKELKQGRNPETGTVIEAMEECCLLAHSSCLLNLLSSGMQGCQPRLTLPTVGWALLCQSLIEKMLYSCLQPSLKEAFSQLGVPPLRWL